MNVALLKKAFQDWQQFTSNLTEDEKKDLSRYTEDIDSTELHYFAAIDDAVRFDQNVNLLSNRYLYDEEVVPVVYRYYIQRNLHELAYDYVMKAGEYYKKNDEPMPQIISELVGAATTTESLNSFRRSMERITGLHYKDIPSITPDAINNKRNLNEFILNEMVQASRVVLDKIHAVKQITHENRYNDLLLAILRLRFPFYGWTIQDQPRTGNSPTGKDAGLIDILIQSGGQSVAFVEALILRHDDVQKTKEHLMKCAAYIPYVERYYSLVYFLGKSENFDTIWNSYQLNVLTTAFPAALKVKADIGFENLVPKFLDVRHLKIAKTIHTNGVEMFHLMINLGKEHAL